MECTVYEYHGEAAAIALLLDGDYADVRSVSIIENCEQCKRLGGLTDPFSSRILKDRLSEENGWFKVGVWENRVLKEWFGNARYIDQAGIFRLPETRPTLTIWGEDGQLHVKQKYSQEEIDSMPISILIELARQAPLHYSVSELAILIEQIKHRSDFETLKLHNAFALSYDFILSHLGTI